MNITPNGRPLTMTMGMCAGVRVVCVRNRQQQQKKNVYQTIN